MSGEFSQFLSYIFAIWYKIYDDVKKKDVETKLN